MPKPVAIGVPCDICQQDSYWDNRENKKNPKAPDWSCATKECPGKDGYKFGRWEKDRAKWDPNFKKAVPAATPAPKGGRLTGDDTTPDERGENVASWEALCYTYGKLYKAVHGTVRSFIPSDLPVDHSVVQAGVATLLIQGEKARIPLLHPRKPTPEPVAAPPKKPVKAEEFPEGLEPEEWEPPF